jgi:hypothetical protein
MVKSASPTPISAGAVHLDGARLASQRRLRSAIFPVHETAQHRVRSPDSDEVIRATCNRRWLFQVDADLDEAFAVDRTGDNLCSDCASSENLLTEIFARV